MYDSLIRYFNSYTSVPLSESDIDLITSVFAPKKFKKKQYFLQEGEISKYGAFVVRGAMRRYMVDDKGEEHIVQLMIENWWASDYESYIKGTPSKYFIDAWEETETLLTTMDNINKLIEKIPLLLQWTKKLDENHFVATQNRLSAAISLSAEERYYKLEKAHPQFLRRFPQRIIASYLGINRETLSRIRSRATKK